MASRRSQTQSDPQSLRWQLGRNSNAEPHGRRALRFWAKKLAQSKPFKLVAVALANRMARIAFAIMRGKTTYRAVPA